MWTPIADTETAERCWRALEAIEVDLVSRLPAIQDPLLASGTAGLALFFSYFCAARTEGEAADRALEALEQSVAALGEGDQLPALYGGFSGVGWTVEHLTRHFFEGDGDLCSELDEALCTALSAPGPPLKYELLNGLAGFGIYLLERPSRPGVTEALGRILERLDETSEESQAGLTWPTLPEWVPFAQREWMPEGGYNLGVAHGVPGVVGFLAAAWREGVADPRVERLAEGAVRWILAQRQPAGGRSVFPTWLIPGQEPTPARTAWCYGDLGIAAVLMSAARSFHRLDWEEEALSLARLAATRPADAFKVLDAGLCHGAAGIAHLFNRFYQATGDLQIRAAALAWYRHALDLRCTTEGIGGFLSYVRTGPEPGTWESDPGFLAGAAGIGLALLGAVSDVEPAWDRVMLVAIPPGATAPDGGEPA